MGMLWEGNEQVIRTIRVIAEFLAIEIIVCCLDMDESEEIELRVHACRSGMLSDELEEIEAEVTSPAFVMALSYLSSEDVSDALCAMRRPENSALVAGFLAECFGSGTVREMLRAI